ncbi:hypothetical protein PTKIN_Ptkin02bG0130400 [Pterospermum kingtungense]
MSVRSRTSVSAGTYEDFQAQVERKQEQGANILLIHLPGFPKEQISVTYVDSSRTIKVEAERALENNRRSRFNRAFPVPQNCIPENTEGTFRNGVLSITVPIKTIPQVDSVKDVNTAKEATPPKPLKDQKETTTPKADSTPTSGFAKQKDEKVVPPQTPQKVIPEPKAPTAMGPQKSPIEALQPSKQQQETPKKAAPIATTTKQTEEKTVSSSAAEIVEKRAESKEKENVKTKDSTMSESNIQKILEKGKKDDKGGGGAAAVEEKPKESGSSFLEKAKEIKGMDTIMKTVKKLATDDYEDRQLLINIGVSVLVIVALGAYITYSYRSSGKAQD